jgi:hypothetical protein
MGWRDALKAVYWLSLGMLAMGGLISGLVSASDQRAFLEPAFSAATSYVAPFILAVNVGSYVSWTYGEGTVRRIGVCTAVAGGSCLLLIMWGVIGAMVVGPRKVDTATAIMWSAFPAAFITVSIAAFLGMSLRLAVAIVRALRGRARKAF